MTVTLDTLDAQMKDLAAKLAVATDGLTKVADAVSKTADATVANAAEVDKLKKAADAKAKAKDDNMDDDADEDCMDGKASTGKASAGKAADAAIKAAVDAALKPFQDKLDAAEKAKPAFDEKDMYAKVAQRDELAQRLSGHIGTFDHKAMTMDEVVKYGMDKLELKADKGMEKATLDGFLHNRKAPHEELSFGLDTAPTGKGSSIASQLETQAA